MQIILTITVLITMIGTLITFLRQFIDFYKEYPIITYILIGLILLIGALIYVFIYKRLKSFSEKILNKENLYTNVTDLNIDNKNDIEINEKSPKNNIEMNNIDMTKGQEFGDFENIGDIVELNPGQIKKNKDFINYEQFLQLYKNNDFLESFTESVKLNLKIKKERYIKLFQEIKEEYLIAKKNCPNSFIPNPKYQEQVDASESVLKEIKEIIKQIDIINMQLEREGKKWSLNRLNMALYDKNNGLNCLIGRDDIKNFLAIQLYTFSKNPRIFFSTFQNIALYAPSGYGKTKIGQTIGWVLSKCGILIKEKFQVVTKSAMTTPYVNESGSKTRNLLLSNLEGILLIDEAYDITPPTNTFGFKGIDHGHEAVTELVNFIDKMMGLNIIIAAGYPEEMKERFMKANQGMPRRFPHVITLDAYTAEDLSKILLSNLKKSNPDLNISKDDINYLYTIIDYLEKSITNKKMDINIDDDINAKGGHKTFFPKQGGDMLNLSAYISNSYYSNIKSKDLKLAILNGFNEYLSKNNLHIKEQYALESGLSYNDNGVLSYDNKKKSSGDSYKRFTRKDSNSSLSYIKYNNDDNSRSNTSDYNDLIFTNMKDTDFVYDSYDQDSMSYSATE